MITTQDLEMIPPIQGRERTFGWFPPAHNQYCRVPYKIMAVLDDFKYFHKPEVVKAVSSHHIADNEATVLSSKLNAIRQELTKKPIVPSVIRQQCLIKPNSIQEYMKIPVSWRPKYPELDIDILSIDEESTRPTVLKETTTIISSYDKDSSQRTLARRPYTAPGHTLKIHDSSKCSTASSGNRLHTSGSVTRNSKPSSLLQQKLRQTSASDSNLSNLRYDRDLEKFKWLMEIPGDPFDIKKGHIPEKQQYFHQVGDIKILPQEPCMQKQNRDTFFYNAMPTQTLSFDISPSFMSEKYNRVKNKLRSQGKWNYSSKNFSFVY